MPALMTVGKLRTPPRSVPTHTPSLPPPTAPTGAAVPATPATAAGSTGSGFDLKPKKRGASISNRLPAVSLPPPPAQPDLVRQVAGVRALAQAGNTAAGVRITGSKVADAAGLNLAGYSNAHLKKLDVQRDGKLDEAELQGVVRFADVDDDGKVGPREQQALDYLVGHDTSPEAAWAFVELHGTDGQIDGRATTLNFEAASALKGAAQADRAHDALLSKNDREEAAMRAAMSSRGVNPANDTAAGLEEQISALGDPAKLDPRGLARLGTLELQLNYAQVKEDNAAQLAVSFEAKTRARGISDRAQVENRSAQELLLEAGGRLSWAKEGVAHHLDRSVEILEGNAVDAREKVAKASGKMAKLLHTLGPALNEGVVVPVRGPQGRLRFEIARLPGMKESEHQKLEEKFGEPLRQLAHAARGVERELGQANARREAGAAELVKQVNDPTFVAYLKTLPPAERLGKVNGVAAQVAGTKAGQQLADELLDFAATRQGPTMGLLTPSTPLGKTLFDGVYSDPAAVTQLKGLALNLAGHLSGNGGEAMRRLAVISLGRPLTKGEERAASQLARATPEQLSPEGLEHPEGFDQYGDVTSLLSAFGEGAEAHVPEGTVNKFHAGAVVVGTFQLMRSLSELAEKGPTVAGAVDVSEDLSRSVGAWAAVTAEHGSAFAAVGRKLSLASDVIGLAKDLHEWSKAASPEKKYDGFVNSYASALIVAGSIAASVTPWGVAAQVVGLGIKLVRPETSDRYDASYRRLKQATRPVD